MRNIALVREAVDPGAAANEVHQAIRASPIPSNCFQHNIMISYNTLVQAHRTLTTHVHLPLVCFSIAHSKGPTEHPSKIAGVCFTIWMLQSIAKLGETVRGPTGTEFCFEEGNSGRMDFKVSGAI